MDGFLIDDIGRYIGQTVTIFTTSGGLSGGGFTGVLLSFDCKVVRLLADIGAPPACPVGSACNSCFTPCGMINPCEMRGRGYGNGYGGYGNGYGGYGNGYGGYGCDGCLTGCNGGFDGCCCNYNPLGSVVVIPVHAIAAFSHNAI